MPTETPVPALPVWHIPQPLVPGHAAPVVVADIRIDPAPAPAPASAAPVPGDVPRRDPLIDLIRAVALTRVVVWHTFPLAALTWVAAMPVMFAVAGALLVASSHERRHRHLVAARVGRILVPLWAYGAFVAVATATVAVRSGDGFAPVDVIARAVATWVLPVVDPVGPAWLTTPLWYVRAYLWLVLGAPLVVRAARHWRTGVAVAAGSVALLEVAAHRGWWTGTPRVLVGDLAAYGLFAVLGGAWSLRRDVRRSPVVLLAAAGAAATAAASWALLVGVPGDVVSNSYPMTVLVGVATVCALGAVEHPVRRFAAQPRVAAAGRTIGGRSLTVYLWHAAGVALAAALIDRGGLSSAAARVAVVAGVTAAAIVVLGPLEGRPGRGRPPVSGSYVRRGALRGVAVVAACALAVPLAAAGAPSPDVSARPPSWRAPLGDAAFAHDAPSAVVLSTGAARAASASGALPAADLQRALDTWRVRNGLRAASVAISVDGRVWEATSGSTAADPYLRLGAPYGIASVSKTVTATLVMQAVAAGRLDLDEPVPAVPGLPERAWRPTPRQLLQHSAGLVESVAAGRGRAESVAAVAAALPPPAWRPGPESKPAYVSANFIYLGLVLEVLTGRPYEDLVADLARSHDLKSITTLPGPGSATGGITATASDLARFGDALLSARTVLPAATVDEMTRFDEHNVGLGVWPGCPCFTDADGHKRATSVGHHVGAGGLYVWPGELSLAVRMAPAGSNNEAVDLSLELGEVLRAVLR